MAFRNAKARSRIISAQENGKLGGRPKRAQQEPSGLSLGSLPLTQPKALHVPPNQTPKPNPPHPPETPGGSRFPEFWEAWPRHPRKVARPQCLKKWQSLGCDDFADRVLASLEAAKRSTAWAKDAGEFIPAPMVWLNQARWEAPTDTDTLVAAPSPTAWRHSGQGCYDKSVELGIAQQQGEFDEQFRARVFKTWERRQASNRGQQ